MPSESPGPASGRTARQRGSAERSGPSSTPGESRGRVLLVDDEPLFRDSTRSLLHASGYDCEAVDGPAAAFAAIDAHSYDVLVTDLVMGGEAQLEFLNAIAAREDTPAVIVVTAYPSIESAVTAVDLGLMGYLQKPFEAEDLIKRIEDALERRRYASLLSNMESSLREASEQLRNVSRLAEARPGLQRGEAPPVRDPLLARQLDALTPREREILDELMDGYRISTVARRLEISPHTVRRHLKHIFVKLEVRSQAELLEKLKP